MNAPKQFNPEMLVLARTAREVTQAELASELGVTQGTISKIEAGQHGLSETEISTVADYLGYSDDFFSWDDTLVGFGMHDAFHRRRHAAGAKKLASVNAELNIRCMQLTRLLRSFDIGGREMLQIEASGQADGPAGVARMVRAAWQMPPGPVRDLIKVIEGAGGAVIYHDFDTGHIDATALWPPGLPPVFFLNRSFPSDRLRFTLAHELGHIIMHGIPDADSEREADAFAAEFLMPERDIRADLKKVDLPTLASLKMKWGVSMQALLYRAGDLGLISTRMQRTRWMQMSKLGYRKREPVEIRPERPELLRELLESHRSELGFSTGDLAALLGYRDSAQVQSLSDERYSRFRIVS